MEPGNMGFSVILAITAFIVAFTPTSFGLGLGYGEICNTTYPCDLPSWLGCFDGKCDCLKDGRMLYDETRKKCVFKAGERCKYGAKVGQENTFLVQVHYCVENASCSNPEGICKCDDRFYQTSEGTCERAQGHKEPCTPENDQCSVHQGLMCHEPDGICECDPVHAIFSTKEDQCVGLSGRRCINSKCVQNADCTEEDYCDCKQSFYPDADGFCREKVSVFKNCTEDVQCQSEPGLNLICLNGHCNCHPKGFVYATVWPSHRENHVGRRFHGYEGEAKTQCVPLAGQECIDRLCAPRAYCEFENSNHHDLRGHCICAPGYMQSLSNHCGRGYGESCESADECIEGLVCKNRLCSCEFANQLYDPSHMNCYSKVGGACTNDNNCIRNAICHTNSNSVESPGNKPTHCTCKEGFVENLKGECEEGYGGLCKDKDECDSVANLDCVNNICKCSDFAIYNSRLRKCVGKVGSDCNLGKKNECIEHAHCAPIHPKLHGHCVCNSEFEETRNYTCVMPSKLSAIVHDEE